MTLTHLVQVRILVGQPLFFFSRHVHSFFAEKAPPGTRIKIEKSFGRAQYLPHSAVFDPPLKRSFPMMQITGFAKYAGTLRRFGRTAGTCKCEAHLTINGVRDLSGDDTGGAFLPRLNFSSKFAGHLAVFEPHNISTESDELNLKLFVTSIEVINTLHPAFTFCREPGHYKRR